MDLVDTKATSETAGSSTPNSSSITATSSSSSSRHVSSETVANPSASASADAFKVPPAPTVYSPAARLPNPVQSSHTTSPNMARSGSNSIDSALSFLDRNFPVPAPPSYAQPPVPSPAHNGNNHAMYYNNSYHVNATAGSNYANVNTRNQHQAQNATRHTPYLSPRGEGGYGGRTATQPAYGSGSARYGGSGHHQSQNQNQGHYGRRGGY